MENNFISTNLETVVLGFLLTVIIGLLTFIGKRLALLLSEIQTEIKLLNNRQDMNDVVVSHFLEEPYNSRDIIQGKSKFPNIFRTIRES